MIIIITLPKVSAIMVVAHLSRTAINVTALTAANKLKPIVRL